MGGEEYYDSLQFFTKSSVEPGKGVLIITSAYTFLCVLIGFLLKCRNKKSWTRDKDDATQIDDESYQDISTGKMPIPYLFAVDNVIENALFNDETDDSHVDITSAEADDTRKAYEYYQERNGGLQVIKDSRLNEEASFSYELYEDYTKSENRYTIELESMEPEVATKSTNSLLVATGMEPRNDTSAPPSGSRMKTTDITATAQAKTNVEITKNDGKAQTETRTVRVEQNKNFQQKEDFIQNPILKSQTDQMLHSLKKHLYQRRMFIEGEDKSAAMNSMAERKEGEEKMFELPERSFEEKMAKRFVSHTAVTPKHITRRNRSLNLARFRRVFIGKKRKYSFVSNPHSPGLESRRHKIPADSNVNEDCSSVSSCDDPTYSYNRMLHKPNGLDIELKEIMLESSAENVMESYANFEDREDPIKDEKYFGPNLNTKSSISSTHTSNSEDRTSTLESENDTFDKEIEEFHKVSIAGAISTFIPDLASLFVIVVVSNYISLTAVICISYNRFIIEAVFIYSSALHSSLFTHVNNAVASETEGGYYRARTYIMVCIIIEVLISIPVSLLVVYGMGPILRLYGFNDDMLKLCHGYGTVLVVQNVMETTMSFLSIRAHMYGNADFNSKYLFFDSLVDAALSAVFITLFSPSILHLGLFHLAQEIVSTLFFYYLTCYKWDRYEDYKGGMKFGAIYDRKVISALIKKSVPMAIYELNGMLEWLVLAYFASFLGSAESASWILLSYICGLIEVLPGCAASAAACRVTYQLRKGNIQVAQQISNRCMFWTGVLSWIEITIMFCVRRPLVNALTSEEEVAVSEMLLGALPYVFFCEPMISLTVAGAHLNCALLMAMHQQLTTMALWKTFTLTLPAAWISTYVFGWDISGLVAASYIGCATAGVVDLLIYNNADWEGRSTCSREEEEP